MAVISLNDSQHSTLRYAQLDQAYELLERLAGKVQGLQDMRDEDPHRRIETTNLLSTMKLLREDLDALEVLLRQDVPDYEETE